MVGYDTYQMILYNIFYLFSIFCILYTYKNIYIRIYVYIIIEYQIPIKSIRYFEQLYS
jgi:hypothetical protein